MQTFRIPEKPLSMEDLLRQEGEVGYRMYMCQERLDYFGKMLASNKESLKKILEDWTIAKTQQNQHWIDFCVRQSRYWSKKIIITTTKIQEYLSLEFELNKELSNIREKVKNYPINIIQGF